jgi:hypothetical protein
MTDSDDFSTAFRDRIAGYSPFSLLSPPMQQQEEFTSEFSSPHSYSPRASYPQADSPITTTKERSRSPSPPPPPTSTPPLTTTPPRIFGAKNINFGAKGKRAPTPFVAKPDSSDEEDNQHTNSREQVNMSTATLALRISNPSIGNPYDLSDNRLTREAILNLIRRQEYTTRFISECDMNVWEEFRECLEFRIINNKRNDDSFFSRITRTRQSRRIFARISEQSTHGKLTVFSIQDLSEEHLEANVDKVIAILGCDEERYVTYVRVWPDRKFYIKVDLGLFANKSGPRIVVEPVGRISRTFIETHVVFFTGLRNPLEWLGIEQPPRIIKHRRRRQKKEEVKEEVKEEMFDEKVFNEDADDEDDVEEEIAEEIHPRPPIIHYFDLDEASDTEYTLATNFVVYTEENTEEVIQTSRERDDLQIPQQLTYQQVSVEISSVLDNTYNLQLYSQLKFRPWNPCKLITLEDFKFMWKFEYRRIISSQIDSINGSGLGLLVLLTTRLNLIDSLSIEDYTKPAMIRVFRGVFVSIRDIPTTNSHSRKVDLVMCFKYCRINEVIPIPTPPVGIVRYYIAAMQHNWILVGFQIDLNLFNNIGSMTLFQVLFTKLKEEQEHDESVYRTITHLDTTFSKRAFIY